MSDLGALAASGTYRLEVVILPVTDVDRAKAFYTDGMGFHLDVDHRAGEDFRIVQLTPTGSACSVTLMAQPDRAGAVQGLHLVVPDIEAARSELTGRGVDCSDFFHFAERGQTPGLHPDRADFGSFFSIQDPDGNGWLLQEHGRSEAERVGHAYVGALAAKDWDTLRALFADEVDIKATTPGRHWIATTPQEFVDELLGHWFEDSDHIQGIERVATRPHHGRHHLQYELAVTNLDGDFTVEQQGYYDLDDDGRIQRMHLVCAGYRPVDA